MNLDNKSLLVYKLDGDKDRAYELKFDSRYGSIVTFYCKDDGDILVAFKDGTVVLCPTDRSAIGVERVAYQCQKSGLLDMIYSESTKCLATCSYETLHIAGIGTHKVKKQIIFLSKKLSFLD